MDYVIGMGANLAASGYDAPEDTLRAAAASIGEMFVVLKQASLYKSPPYPPSGQPWYINSACLLRSECSARQLLIKLMEIEKKWGRNRTVKNAARTLDLDILAALDSPEVVCEENASNPLYVPHPRLHLRSFVLFPMSEVVPDWHHPVLRKSIAQLCSELNEPIPAQRIDQS